MILNKHMSIWCRSSQYLSIQLMANALGRLSLLNSLASPGTLSEKLVLDKKLQIILILQRQQYRHKHFPWFEQWFHCFTSPYWSGLLIIVFQVTRDIFSKSCWDTGLSKLILQNVLFYHCNTYNESGELALHQIFIFMNAWYREKYILSPGTLSLSCPFSADKSNWSCRMIINRANLWSLGIIF